MAPAGVKQQVFALGDEAQFTQNRTDIAEYLEQQQAYAAFDHLLKELIVKQPDDPLQFMIDTLRNEEIQGVGLEGLPKVVFKGPPGPDRGIWAERIAAEYDLSYIDPGKELQKEGIDAELYLPEDLQRVRDFVQKEIAQATTNRKGWLLNGFPRTHEEVVFLAQTCKVVPTRCFLMNVPEEVHLDAVAAHAVRRGEGDAEGNVLPEAMARIRRQHAAYYSNLLQVVEQYRNRLRQLDFTWISGGETEGETAEEKASRECWKEGVWEDIKKSMMEQPHTKGPTRAPRVVMLGPYGSMASEQAAALANHLQAPLLDGNIFRKDITATGGGKLVGEAVEKAVFERLGQRDVTEMGYVMVNFPESAEQAARLRSKLTGRWAPNRVVALQASLNTCVARQTRKYTDPVTGVTYIGSLPIERCVRDRVRRADQDFSEKVKEKYEAFTASVGGSGSQVLSSLGFDRCGAFISTEVDDTPTADSFTIVHDRICDFVLRPLMPAQTEK